jgi:serine/threonine protein kinase
MKVDASVLIGKNLKNNWVIDRPHLSYSGATGGTHSLCYIAKNDVGDEAFIKILDTSINRKKKDRLSDLKLRVDVFQYERELIAKCKDLHMNGVIRGIDYGELDIDKKNDPLFYLILELADSDLREQTEINKRLDLAFQMRTLHRTAVGLKQLHWAGIAHQDIKPSNILTFKSGETKLGDLGHAWDKSAPRPGEDEIIAGDHTYAPLEQLYGYRPTNWAERRLAADLYHLGCLAVFLLTGVSATTCIKGHLIPEHQWDNWTGTYEDVLPFVREATEAVIEETSECIPDEHREELIGCIRHLLEPEPILRNHPRNREGLGGLYGLERFISRFDLIAKKAEFSLKKALQ